MADKQTRCLGLVHSTLYGVTAHFVYLLSLLMTWAPLHLVLRRHGLLASSSCALWQHTRAHEERYGIEDYSTGYALTPRDFMTYLLRELSFINTHQRHSDTWSVLL